METRLPVAGMLAIAMAAWSSCNACDAWIGYKGAPVLHLAGGVAYAFRSKRMEIDADGAPNAYHSQDRGLDRLANAGYPNGGWRDVLVTDPAAPHMPYVQPTGDFAGFFLSETALRDAKKANTDPAKWVDARNVPYLVLPGGFLKLRGTGRVGQVGIARDLVTGKAGPLIVADVGPSDAPLGEVSIRLAEDLGGHDVSPRSASGVPKGPFAYVLVPGSGANPPWPLPVDKIRARAEAALDKVGGWQAVTECLAVQR